MPNSRRCFPKAGGAYNYIKYTFGNYFGFVNGWFDFMSNAIAPAYFCIVLSEYSILIFPEMRTTFKTLHERVAFLTFFTAQSIYPESKAAASSRK